MTKDNHSQCDWGEGHSEGFEAGVELERERIIKLFSEHYGRFDVSNNMVEGVSEQEFIEIIKSEAQDD